MVLQNALPSGDNLQRRGMLLNTTCCRCREQETLDPILLHCNFAKEVWEMAPWTLALAIQTSLIFATVLQTSQTTKNLPPVGVSGNLFPWISWFIWTARNKLLFKRRASSPSETLIQAIKAIREWELAQASLSKVATRSTCTPRPLDLPESTIFINTDASWKSDAAGLAWIFSDQSSSELARKSISLTHVSSPCMAEALTIRGALLNAASLGFTNICLRTDSQVLHRAITQRKWTMDPFGILSDIAFLSTSSASPFSFCRFDFISRSKNGLADGLAKAQLSSIVPLNSESY